MAKKKGVYASEEAKQGKNMVLYTYEGNLCK